MQEMPQGSKTKPIKSEGRGDPYTTVERSSGLTAGVCPPGQHGNMEVDRGSQLHNHTTDQGAASTTSTAAAATASEQQSKEQGGALATTTCSFELEVGPGPLNLTAATSMKQSKAQSGALSTTACSVGPVVGPGPLDTDNLQVHGAPTNGRKRTIGGKNTKWAVSTQQAKQYMYAC